MFEIKIAVSGQDRFEPSESISQPVGVSLQLVDCLTHASLVVVTEYLDQAFTTLRLAHARSCVLTVAGKETDCVEGAML